MTGNETQENKYSNKINVILNKNKNKPYLKSFGNYMKGAWTTKYNYLQYAANFMNYIDNKPVNEITIDDYINYMAELKGTSSYKIGVYSGLKQFSTYLYKTEKNSRNAMNDVERPKKIETVETINKRKIGYLNQDEIQVFLDGVENGVGNKRAKARQEKWRSRDIAIAVLALTTGLRASGIYKLDVDSINFETHKLITMEKGSKVREITLTDDTIEVLKEWLNDRSKLNLDENEKALFISNRRQRLDTQTLYYNIRKYGSVIEGKHITPHKLRATYGTSLYAATGDIYMVQKNMGHSSPQTSELYVRGQDDIADQKAKEIMSNLIKIKK